MFLKKISGNDLTLGKAELEALLNPEEDEIMTSDDDAKYTALEAAETDLSTDYAVNEDSPNIRQILCEAVRKNELYKLSAEQLAEAIELIYNIEAIDAQKITAGKLLSSDKIVEALMEGYIAEKIVLNHTTRLWLINQLSKCLDLKKQEPLVKVKRKKPSDASVRLKKLIKLGKESSLEKVTEYLGELNERQLKGLAKILFRTKQLKVTENISVRLMQLINDELIRRTSLSKKLKL